MANEVLYKIHAVWNHKIFYKRVAGPKAFVLQVQKNNSWKEYTTSVNKDI